MFWPTTPFPCIQVENIFFLWMLRSDSAHWVRTQTNPSINNSFRWPQSSKCACVIYLYRKLWDRDISVAHRLCLAWLTVPSKTYSNILVYLSSATHNDCYAGASVYFLLWRCKVCIFISFYIFLYLKASKKSQELHHTFTLSSTNREGMILSTVKANEFTSPNEYFSRLWMVWFWDSQLSKPESVSRMFWTFTCVKFV